MGDTHAQVKHSLAPLELGEPSVGGGRGWAYPTSQTRIKASSRTAESEPAEALAKVGGTGKGYLETGPARPQDRTGDCGTGDVV